MILIQRYCYVLAVVLALGLNETVVGQLDDPFGADPFEAPALDDLFGAPADEDPFGAPAEPPAAEKPKPAPKEPDEPEPLEPPTPKVPVDPEAVRLYLVDGTTVAGKLSIPHFTVDTRFGSLQVPIVKIRTLVPGLDSRAEIGQRVRQLIEDLGVEDYRQREEAQKELIKMGLPVRRVLQKHSSDGNAERARRIKTILAHFEEVAEEAEQEAPAGEWIQGDTVQTTSFTIVGKISPDTFALTSKYGTLSVRLADVRRLRRLQEATREQRYKSLSVGGAHLAQLQYKTSGIRVEKGDRISVRAEGQINRSGSSTYRSTPIGASRLGTFSQNPTILGGTLVARIGGGGNVIKVGSNRTFTAPRSGTLRFAIAMRPDYVGRYQFLGEYKLKVRVSPK